MTTKHRAPPEDIDVKIPLTRRWPAPKVTIVKTHGDERVSETFELQDLPSAAQEAFLRWNGVPKEVQEMGEAAPWVPGDASDYPEFDSGSKSGVWMCKECAARDDEYGNLGYLTQQSACKTTERRSPSCSHTWEEEYNSGVGLGLDWGGPEPWGGEILINGDTAAPTSAERDRQIKIALMEEWDYTADPVAETVVDLPDSGETTINGETAGKEWTATVTVDEYVTVNWRRELPDGRILEGELHTDVRKQECNSSSFTKVYPSGMGVRDEEFVDVPSLDADEVPNHASHMGRIQNRLGSHLSAGEMTEQVANAIMEFYQKHR